MNLADKMIEVSGHTVVYGAREADVFAMVKAILYLDTQLNIMANTFTDCDGLREHKNSVQAQALTFFKTDT